MKQKKGTKLFAKSTSLLLTLLLMLSLLLLVGCDSTEETDQTDDTAAATEEAVTETEATAEEETQAQEDPTDLIMYIRQDPQTDTDIVQEALNEYLTETINVTLDMNFVSASDYTDKMNVIINSGEYFDICFAASYINFYEYAGNGAFYAITDLLPEVTPDLVEFLPDYLLEGTQVNGENYCVPIYKDICCAHFWCLDKEIVDKYDIDYESLDGSLESLGPVFELLQEKIDSGEEENLVLYPVISSGHRVINNEYSMLVSGLPIGIDVIENGTTVTCAFENERILDTLRTLHEYYEAGYIPAEAATTSSYEFSDDTIQFITAPQGYPLISLSYDRECYEVQWSTGWTSTEMLMGGAQAISVNSSYPEKALQFIELLVLDEYVLNTVNFGLEDVHYTKTSDTHIERTDEQAALYTAPTWRTGTFFETLWTVNSEPEDKWDTVQAWIEEDIYPLEINGFLYDTTNTQDAIAAVTNAYAKFSSMVLTGTSDPDEIVPEMLEALYAAGMQEIIDDMQAQIDEFMASK